MSFLSKLKERLFKTSSKIEEGLESIIDNEADLLENADDSVLLETKMDQAITLDKSLKEQKTEKGSDSRSSDESSYTESTSFRNSKDGGSPETSDQEVNSDDSLELRKMEESSHPKEDNKGFFSKILNKKILTGKRRVVDDKLLESLEELLISSDLGVNTAIKISAAFAEVQYGRKLNKNEIKLALAGEIKKILTPVAVPISISKEKLQVVLVVGVNGSGKTTTIGKLANQFKGAGKVVKIVAADTFRAAAVEQLEVWGHRVDVPVLKTSAGGDPAALAYDSMVLAQQDGTEILIIDTARRLQNKSDLMEELAKIVRVLRKVDINSPHTTLLVLDASIGQNAISQVEVFKKTADISGLVMTKLDGSAKGGILVALADRFHLPIHAIGIGEGIDDLQPFDPEEFTIALTGVDEL